MSSSIYIAVESESCYEMIDEQNIKTLFISLPLCSSSASREHERERSLVHSTLILLSSTRLYWVSTRCLYISIQSQSQWFIVKKIELSHWSRAVAVANCWTHTIVAYLIKSSKFCSFSVMTFDGLAAISHSNFGRHASRILFANVILSFKSICSNFALVFDFFEMKSSISLVDGESAKKFKTMIEWTGTHRNKFVYCTQFRLLLRKLHDISSITHEIAYAHAILLMLIFIECFLLSFIAFLICLLKSFEMANRCKLY